MAYSLKFPIDLDDKTSFIMNEDLVSNAKQNLKMIILTDKGERIMNPDFGVGLRRYLFENISNGNILKDGNLEKLETKLFQDISKQVSRYATNITINDLKIEVLSENEINVKLYYTVDGFYEDELQISF
jgi:phage baseplate assembly protein W